MSSNVVHGFVDGGYLASRTRDAKRPLVDPHTLVLYVTNNQGYARSKQMQLERVTYYDAIPDDESDLDPDIKSYWDAVELLDDTQLGFGSLRGGTRKKPRRQKGVDTLIAVDMLVGAFTDVFSTAILVAGDADYVPVVNEVQRRGKKVIVAAVGETASTDLKRCADRFFDLESDLNENRYPSLVVEGKNWPTC